MELKIELTYQELLELVEQLSEEEFAQLSTDLKVLREKKIIEEKGNDFRKFLLSGPVMSEEQYHEFVQDRNWSVKNLTDN